MAWFESSTMLTQLNSLTSMIQKVKTFTQLIQKSTRMLAALARMYSLYLHDMYNGGVDSLLRHELRDALTQRGVVCVDVSWESRVVLP